MTPTAYGCDFSFDKPTGAELVAAGRTFIMGYLPVWPGDDTPKPLRKEHIEDYRNHGIDIGAIYESTAQLALQGYDAGVAAAVQSEMEIDNLGFPENQVIYFTVDFDVLPSQYGLVDAFFRGCMSVVGLARVGCYAHNRYLAHIRDLGFATYYWQCLAWSYGQVFGARHLFQSSSGHPLGSGLVDDDEAYGEDQGLWKANMELQERVQRLESIVAGFGIMVPDGAGGFKKIGGEEALAYAYAPENQWSAFLGIWQTRVGIAALETRVDQIDSPGHVAEHKHNLTFTETGGVILP